MITFNFDQKFETVILANGSFPKRAVLLKALQNCQNLVCCDGAVDQLICSGIQKQPSAVIGDMDSVSSSARTQFANQCISVSDQNTNDLEKALIYCQQKNWLSVLVLGAAGLREDHFLGNFSLLMSYGQKMDLVLATETADFIVVQTEMNFEAPIGTSVSLFASSHQVALTTQGLQWELQKQNLSTLHSGILNRTTNTQFCVKSENGPTVVCVNR